jgi:hypothetical protein
MISASAQAFHTCLPFLVRSMSAQLAMLPSFVFPRQTPLSPNRRFRGV